MGVGRGRGSRAHEIYGGGLIKRNPGISRDLTQFEETEDQRRIYYEEVLGRSQAGLDLLGSEICLDTHSGLVHAGLNRNTIHRLDNESPGNEEIHPLMANLWKSVMCQEGYKSALDSLDSLKIV